MSVYQRTNAAGETIWRYDFQFEGGRYLSEEPHHKTRAKAAAAETKRKRELKRGAKLPNGLHHPRSYGARGAMIQNAVTNETAKGIITLEQACDRFWRDVGRHHRSADDIERRLAHVKRIVGADAKVVAGGIAAISTSVVIAAVRARRAEESLNRWGRSSGKPVTNAGANRDIIDQLRPVLHHAAVAWEDELALRVIKWKDARLKEGDEQVCEFSDDEIARWGDALSEQQSRHGRDGATERAFLTLALGYGPRLGELHFPPDAFRPDAPEGAELDLGRYIGKGGVRRDTRKDGSLHTIPLLDDAVAMLQPFVDRARAERAQTIWLEQDGDGVWRSISYDAMRGRLVRAAEAAGIDQARLIHGMRHHAGSAVNREGGLTRVQALLGHKQITTSRRYAHTKKADLRADLERVSAQKNARQSRPSPAQSR